MCGTDAEFYSGEMAYLHTGDAAYPIRIGHEWCGVVVARSAPASTRPGSAGGSPATRCSAAATCARCLGGRQHLCADRYEIGIRGGWPGALAEQLPVPVRALHPLPDSVDADAGRAGRAGRQRAAGGRAAALTAGERLLVLGPGTIGLLVALIAAAPGRRGAPARP